MTTYRKRIGFVILGWLIVACAGAQAAELFMFDDKGCAYCRRWLAEVGPGYPNTDEGRHAPLRRIDIRAKLPDGLILNRPITVTPTFVLVEDNREVGRLTGYAGAEFFYELLSDVMAKLPRAPSTSKPDARSGAALR